MSARIITVDSLDPEPEKIAEAAVVIRGGGLLGLPTETVYGLAADALHPSAVQKIFRAKGRPADNPLICHIASPVGLQQLVSSVPDKAKKLMKAFWPGPLTLILPALPTVPLEVTAGTGNVAVRMPSHPVARAVIEASGVPLAAPSANLSGRPSPTTAQHVLDDLGDVVDMILDAGESDLGVESTVVDVTGERPVLARLGGISREDIISVVGRIEEKTKVSTTEAPTSPGQKYRHYAPSIPLVVVTGLPDTMRGKLAQRLREYRAAGTRVTVLCMSEHLTDYEDIAPCTVLAYGSWTQPGVCAHYLFALLRSAERTGASVLLAESLPMVGVGEAAQARLLTAASEVV